MWDDTRLVRKLRPLQNSEKISSRTHYKMILVAAHKHGRKPNLICSSLFTEDRKAKGKLEGFEIPQNLVCPLCGNVMVDPVMIATGKVINGLFPLFVPFLFAIFVDRVNEWHVYVIFVDYGPSLRTGLV